MSTYFIIYSLCSVLILQSIVVETRLICHKKGIATIPVFDLHEQSLFTKNSSNPQNYTIAYKYLSTGVSGIFDYVQLDVNGTQESDANIDFTRHIDLEKSRIVDATVHIQNATDFTSNITIQGQPGFKFDVIDGLDRLLNIKMFKPRSYSFICTEHETKHFKRKTIIYEFGTRHIDDFLAYYQSEAIVVDKSMPKFTFHFQNPVVNISYVALSSDSPWAIIFHNRIHKTQHEFRTTVYGLNRRPFKAELIVYGMQN